ncbi:integrase core domain-containing protein [Luteitalea sp.]
MSARRGTCARIPKASYQISADGASRLTTRRSSRSNGRFPDECLKVHWFKSLDDATTKIEAWRQNEHHPYRALKGLSPTNTPGERCHPLQSHSRSGQKGRSPHRASLSSKDRSEEVRRVNDVGRSACLRPYHPIWQPRRDSPLFSIRRAAS